MTATTDKPLNKLRITCQKGLEGLLKDEITALGIDDCQESAGAVRCRADLAGLYRICLWSRLAGRVLLPLLECPSGSPTGLYHACYEFPWEQHFGSSNSVLVDFSGSDEHFRNSLFAAQKIKDGIVDRFLGREGSRPNVDKLTPDLRLYAVLAKGKITLSLDLSGGSLAQRGYPHRPNREGPSNPLAAAILLRAGWPAIAAAGGSLLDPFCDRGTLLIEAVLMAARHAPGLYRRGFGFEHWCLHDDALWRAIREQALATRQDGLASLPLIAGYDQDAAALHSAREILKQAGLHKYVQIARGSLGTAAEPNPDSVPGLIVSHPRPPGDADDPALASALRELGQTLRDTYQGWHAALYTQTPALARYLDIKAVRKYRFPEAQLLCFDINPSHYHERQADAPAPVRQEHEWPPGALMFANRLRKNLRQLASWREREGISCYRLYDADMPEYAVAIDLYDGYAHVQEYAAPAKVDQRAATRRRGEVRMVLPSVLGLAEDRIVYKERRRQKGKSQYEKQEHTQVWKQASRRPMISVGEGQVRLLVNLWEYLDTGLFLDHRPVRLRIAAMARGKRFLNLFCYTATATVHAAQGGASSSLSVDMSRTYLDWAAQNFALNAMDQAKHRLLRADCLTWLREATGQYDLILLDPPSFSNSKKMQDILDIQRDHVLLVKQAMALLSSAGTLIFSNNLRSFKLDQQALADYQIEDISKQTIDRDFAMNPRIHQCWLIRHR